MIEFFETTGVLSIGSRLRRLTEIITRDAADIYRLYDLEIKPKWFPVLYTLMQRSRSSVTDIASSIGQTHPSVSAIVREMKDAGLVTDSKDAADRRTTLVELTPAGHALAPQIERACKAVRAAVAAIEDAGATSLWKAVNRWEDELEKKSLFDRVKDEKEALLARKVEIVDYNPAYHKVFKRLNIMWINSHWSLEAHDLEVLDNPEASILSKGGHILVALVDGCPMGVVALCRMENSGYDYEIAKLAVEPDARGTGVGDAIFSAAIERAQAEGATKLFLESNRLLAPAISLYRKYGFTELKDYHPAYARGDIQMELSLLKSK